MLTGVGCIAIICTLKWALREMARFYLENPIKDNRIVISLDDFNLREACLFVFETVNL